jgi:RNA polymerase-binding transcription factor DksA
MATAKKAPAKKVPSRADSAKKSPAKAAAPSKKVAASSPRSAKSATAKASPAKKAATAGKKAAAAGKKAAAAPAKKSVSAPLKKTPAAQKPAAPTKKASSTPAKKVAAAPAKKVAAAPAKKAAAPAKKAQPAPSKNAAAATASKTPAKKALAKKAAVGPIIIEIPAVKGVSKDGVAYTRDFDVKFLTAQRALLLEEKAALLGQATRLEDEANSLIEEQEMGDVQFDDEGGEGDTMVVERERDLTLSAQARQTIADIETALGRLLIGSYGYSTESGRPIPRERLEAIPWATMLVEEKVGGIGRR